MEAIADTLIQNRQYLKTESNIQASTSSLLEEARVSYYYARGSK